jgi:hypothetical protein
MPHSIHAALLALAGLVLVGCRSPESDFARLCRVAEEVGKDDSVLRPDKPEAIRQRFANGGMTPQTRACVRLVFEPGLPAADKYSAMELCAHNAGATAWTCPALRERWAKPAAPAPSAK